jgi:signal transduction histidine kinase
MDISLLVIFLTYLLSLLSMAILVILLLSGARATSKRFILFISSLFIWLLPQFLAQFVFSSQKSIAAALVRMSLFFVGFVVLTLNLFIRERLEVKRIIILRIMSVISIGLGVLSVTPFTSLKIIVSTSGIAVTSNQPTYYLLTYSVFLSFIISIIILRKTEKQNINLEKRRAFKSLRQALTLSLGLNIFAAVFLAKYEWSQLFTPVSMALMTGIMYVAIFKHRLYDVRSLVARSIAYIGTVLVLSGFYGWVAFGLGARFIFKNSHLSLWQEVLQVILVMVAAFTLPPLKRLFDKLSNRLFYQDAYDASIVLDQFNKILVSTIDTQSLLERAASVIETNIKTQYCAFIINKTDYSEQRLVSSTSTTLTKEVEEELRKGFVAYKKMILVDKLQEDDPIKKILVNADVSVTIMLATKSDAKTGGSGFMVIGPKKSGNVYAAQDLALLQILANELSIAMQNSLRFEEIEKFNETLQQKITDATHELRKTNDKLKALDEAKDEFISMASHQLRTPLTSVKGYVSMVLEGDVGKISGQQKEMLEQAFASSQRMVYLIADLLNVSRLKTGKFVIETHPTQLADVVESEMSQLKETAKAHKLELTYQKPVDFPSINIDETKTRQVVMNFIDNAIYYTPAGGHIKVELSANDKTIEYRVVDDGMGVPKQEQFHLFTKFYRAGNAKKARPDGTGLGLFMAKKVIVAQGGALIFQSEEGKGSTFGFSFPRSVVEVK